MDETSVKVFKASGSVQCTGGGSPPTVMRLELINAGIIVLSSACGSDGLVHVMTCGTPDGTINIFEIPGGQANSALALSYSLLSTLPTATEVPCS